MAFKKTLFQRLFSVSRSSNPIPAPKRTLQQSLIPPDPAKASMAPDSGESGSFKRILQRRPIYQCSVASPHSIRSIPTGDKLIEKLRGLDIARGRIRLDGLIPPPVPSDEKELTASDVKKLLKASQVETMKARLRSIEKSWISYSEYAEICKEGCYGDSERGAEMAKLLDDSGAVIVLGDSVCLRPDQEIKTLVRQI